MQLKPLSDNLVVEPQEEKKAVGEIDLPDTVDPDAPQRGIVTAKGDEVTKVQAGDTVLFRKYAPDQFALDGKKFMLMKESDVIAVITE